MNTLFSYLPVLAGYCGPQMAAGSVRGKAGWAGSWGAASGRGRTRNGYGLLLISLYSRGVLGILGFLPVKRLAIMSPPEIEFTVKSALGAMSWPQFVTLVTDVGMDSELFSDRAGPADRLFLFSNQMTVLRLSWEEVFESLPRPRKKEGSVPHLAELKPGATETSRKAAAARSETFGAKAGGDGSGSRRSDAQKLRDEIFANCQDILSKITVGVDGLLDMVPCPNSTVNSGS
ncbi:MAG: hypothetical protein JWO94_3692 [Verrucomicrobiaceae bacterium]|nr:hypothetical protein [Verrucomicrobiaceae bacterium]